MLLEPIGMTPELERLYEAIDNAPAEPICMMDPEAWFPERGESHGWQRQLCFKCPVRVECLEYAIAIEPSDGMWGGMTAREITELRRAKSSRRTRPGRAA